MWIKTARDFGAVIEEARKRRGWTQPELAEAVGTSRHSVLRLEAGRPVGVDVALRALRALALEMEVHPMTEPQGETDGSVSIDEIVDRARRTTDG